MNTTTTEKNVWINANNGTYYLIPNGIQLPAGNLTLISFSGEEKKVDEQAAAIYIAEEDDAQDYMIEQTEQSIDSVLEQFEASKDTLLNENEMPIASMISDMLGNSSELVLSEEDRKELKAKIDSGEGHELLEEFTKDIGKILARPDVQKINDPAELFNKLMKETASDQSIAIDSAKIQKDVSDSIDQFLKEEPFFKDGFSKLPDDWNK